MLIIVCIASTLPLYKWLGILGGVAWGIIAIAMLYFAYRIEKAREEGKRLCEPIIKLLAGTIAGVIIAMILSLFM